MPQLQLKLVLLSLVSVLLVGQCFGTLVDSTSILDKVVLGYQGWFSCAGDNAPSGNTNWRHWASTTAPAPSSITFELYPDVSEYDPSDLYQTQLGPLGNGSPAKLFSSVSPRVVNTHFSWMRDKGLDGVALQRFVTALSSSSGAYRMNTVAGYARTAAETYGRVFFIEYDISGASNTTWISQIQNDWQTVVGPGGSLALTNSNRYLKQNGKPVVFIWGIGFSGNKPGTPAETITLIDWFKSQGVYVGGGVPYQWRSETGSARVGFLPVYTHLDLLQPWGVGAFRSDAEIDNHWTSIVLPDLQWCATNNVAYQRVMFPGFAWSNWNGGSANSFSRRGGDFLWKQGSKIATHNSVSSNTHVASFIAMFDEYDEGTAVANAAPNSSFIPNNQYFLTLDADGIQMSSDFYLRLSGDITSMLRGQRAITATKPTPYFPSPVTTVPVTTTPVPTTTSHSTTKPSTTVATTTTSAPPSDIYIFNNGLVSPWTYTVTGVAPVLNATHSGSPAGITKLIRWKPKKTHPQSSSATLSVFDMAT